MSFRRFVELIILVSLVLVVSACASEPTLGLTEVLTAEQISAVGCDPEASEGQLNKCAVKALGCEPGDPEQTVKACMLAEIENTYDCGPVEDNGEEEAKTPNEIAACMVEYFQGE